MSTDCLFCKIISGLIPAKVIHQDDLTLGFVDIAPQAPTHVLFVPKRHIATLDDASLEDRELLGHLVFVAAKFAREQGFAEAGYRQVINCNRHGGQTVFHIHLHLLGGRPLTWPPG